MKKAPEPSPSNRLVDLRSYASQLGIRLHVVSMSVEDQEELEVTRIQKMFGIDVITDVVPQNVAYQILKLQLFGSPRPKFCEDPRCIRSVLPPHIYCDKHVDKSSTPAV